MSKALKMMFLIYVVLAVLLGALLLAMPGRFLGWVGWAPVDPILSRLLGAALLAFAWGSWRGMQATERSPVTTLIEMHLAFAVLGVLGLLRHLLIASYPLYVWLVFIVLALFAIGWSAFWLKR